MSVSDSAAVVPAPTPKTPGTGLLDKLPPSFRHLALMGIAWGLANGSHAITALHLNNTEAGLAGIGLTWAAAYFTPLTRQYGIGK